MARAVNDIAKDIRALSTDDKGELLLTLLADLDGTSVRELESLVKDLGESARATNQALESAIARLEGLDEEIERSAAEVRERVLQSDDRWPFAT